MQLILRGKRLGLSLRRQRHAIEQTLDELETIEQAANARLALDASSRQSA